VFLHLSKEEQRKRFIERIDEPEKNWKFSLADIHERNTGRTICRLMKLSCMRRAPITLPGMLFPPMIRKMPG